MGSMRTFARGMLQVALLVMLVQDKPLEHIRAGLTTCGARHGRRSSTHHLLTTSLVQRALFLHANDFKVAKDWLAERFGPPTSQPAGGAQDSPRNSPRTSPNRPAPRGFEFRPDPSTPHAAGKPICCPLSSPACPQH